MLLVEKEEWSDKRKGIPSRETWATRGIWRIQQARSARRHRRSNWWTMESRGMVASRLKCNFWWNLFGLRKRIKNDAVRWTPKNKTFLHPLPVLRPSLIGNIFKAQLRVQIGKVHLTSLSGNCNSTVDVVVVVTAFKPSTTQSSGKLLKSYTPFSSRANVNSFLYS